MTLPTGCKDPNDMLRQNKHKQFTEAWWSAKTYTPLELSMSLNNERSFTTEKRKRAYLIHGEGLNKKLYGMRQGELVTLTGGTGLGKSSSVRER